MPTFGVMNGVLIELDAPESEVAHAQGKHIYAPETHMYGHQWVPMIADSPEEAEARYLASCAYILRLPGAVHAKRQLAVVLQARRFPVKRTCC